MYQVAYFCAAGTALKSHQDRVLVNEHVIRSGAFYLSGQAKLSCFVADGIGSMANSQNAAQYALQRISALFNFIDSRAEALINESLSAINEQLVKLNRTDESFYDSGTTLCGMVLDEAGLLTVNVGDSEIWVFRGGILTRVTTLQVLDEFTPNSPITSFLGSNNEHMTPDFNSLYNQYTKGDIIIITTDGLLKSINSRDLGLMLSEPAELSYLVENLYAKLSSQENPDNLGAIFITAEEV